MAYVLDRTSRPQSPQVRSPNGHKRKAVEIEDRSRDTSREPSVRMPALEYGRPEGTVSTGYGPATSFNLAAFSSCFEAVENLRRRDAIIGVHDEELIQMLSAIIRGGRELYTMRMPWPPMGGVVKVEGGEGETGGRSNGGTGANGSLRPVAPPESSDDWETIYNRYRSKVSGSGEGGAEEGGEGTSEATKPRAKSPEYVDNLNKIHTSLASLHAIVEKTNAEKEELRKIQSSASASSSSIVSPREVEEKGSKEEERPPREKKEEKEKERVEKRKEEKEGKEDLNGKKSKVDDLFDDGSDDEEKGSTVPPAAKRRKEETREEKRRRKEEERKKKRGGEDEFLDSDEDETEKKEREKEKRREEKEREKRKAIMQISGCYPVASNEKEDREKEREREKARKEDKEEVERERLKEKALERERRREMEEEKRKNEEEEKRRREAEERKKREDEERRKKDEEKKKMEERATASPPVMPARKLNKKCTCTLPFPDLSELNEKQKSSYRTLEECGGNWTDLKVSSIVAVLRNGRWVRARVNETRADGLYLGLESSGGGGFSGRVKECTGCVHINKIVAIEKK